VRHRSDPARVLTWRATIRSCSLGDDMLVLSRKLHQTIMIGDDIEISVVGVAGEKVRIGIRAPREVPVYRAEVYRAIQSEREEAAAVESGGRA
jgi:carbon storage regulator